MTKFKNNIKSIVNETTMESLMSNYENTIEDELVENISHTRNFEDLIHNDMRDIYKILKYKNGSRDNLDSYYDELVNVLNDLSLTDVIDVAYSYLITTFMRKNYPRVMDCLTYKTVMLTDLTPDELFAYNQFVEEREIVLGRRPEKKKRLVELVPNCFTGYDVLEFLYLYVLKADYDFKNKTGTVCIDMNGIFVKRVNKFIKSQSDLCMYIKNMKKKSLANKKEFEEKEKTKCSQLKNYLINLSNMNDDDMITIDKLDLSNFTFEMGNELLGNVMQHNDVIYHNLYDYYKKVTTDNYYLFRKMFKKYKYDFDLFTYNQQELILNIKKSDLERYFELIKKIFGNDNIDSRLLAYIMINCNIKDLSKICELHIDRDLLINNPIIMNSNYFNGVFLNSKLLTSRGVKWKGENSDNPLILTNPIVLNNNIITLELFRKNFKDKNITNYDFLKDDMYIKDIDKLIELGLDTKIITKIINDVNISSDKLHTLVKRLFIEKKLNNNIDNNTFSDLVTNYWLDDCFIDNFIINDVNKYINNTISNEINNSNVIIDDYNIDNYYIGMLDKSYKIDNYKYNIGGIIISRYKVIRNLIKLKYEVFDSESLLSIIIHDSILNEEEIDKIASIIVPLVNNNLSK